MPRKTFANLAVNFHGFKPGFDPSKLDTLWEVMDLDKTGSLNKQEAKNFLEQAVMTLQNYSGDAPLDIE